MLRYNDYGMLAMDILLKVFLNIVLGVSVAVAGNYIHRYIKENIIGESISEPEWQQ